MKKILKNQKGFSQLLIILGAAAIAGLIVFAGLTQIKRGVPSVQKPLTDEQQLDQIDKELKALDTFATETDKELQEVQSELNESAVSGL